MPILDLLFMNLETPVKMEDKEIIDLCLGGIRESEQRLSSQISEIRDGLHNHRCEDIIKLKERHENEENTSVKSFRMVIIVTAILSSIFGSMSAVAAVKMFFK